MQNLCSLTCSNQRLRACLLMKQQGHFDCIILKALLLPMLLTLLYMRCTAVEDLKHAFETIR